MTVFILALLVGISVPVLGRGREVGRNAVCTSNLRQWGLATQIYATEWKQYLPMAEHMVGASAKDDPNPGMWYNALPVLAGAPAYTSVYDGSKSKQYPNAHIWWCPTARSQYGPGGFTASGNAFDYAFNTVIDGTGQYPPNTPGDSQIHIRLTRIPKPAATLQMTEPNQRFEWVSIGNSPGWEQVVVARHSGKYANILFVDGHITAFVGKDANTLYSGPGETVNTPNWTTAGGKLVWGSFR